MKSKKRQKLCYNCEASVDLDVIVCPFCAADLREEKPELQRSSFSPSIASIKPIHPEHSLYSTPYARPPEKIEEEKPLPLAIAAEPVEENSPTKTIALSVLLLSLGTQLLLLGLFLLFFSDRGVFILKWNANFWFLYLLLAGPFLFFGLRTIK